MSYYSFIRPMVKRSSRFIMPMKRKRVYKKSVSVASTRRRGVITPSSYRPKYSGYAKNKKVNSNRLRVGLPPLELKYVLDSQSENYVSQTATNWSLVLNPMVVDTGTGPTLRESQKIKTEPFKIRCFINQLINTQKNYRFFVIKVFDNSSSPPNPENVITNYDETDNLAYNATYVQDQDRGDIRYKVLKDFTIINSTYDGRPTLRKISFNIPACNLNYDDNDATGSTSRNKVYVAIMTNATPASGDYIFSHEYTMKFLDQ